MNNEYLFIISFIIALFIVKEIFHLEKSGENEKLKILNIGTYTITGILIISMLYTDVNITFLLMLAILSIPYSGYSMYMNYKHDRKRLTMSLTVFLALLSTVLIVSYM